jgi:DNA-directed RNA polymerase specialized sigma24 family protein
VTLAESLKHFAPPGGASDPADAALRAEALEIVYTEVQRLARRMLPGDAAEDVASHVVVYLLDGGPLDRLSQPDTDSNVRSYLAVAIRNEWIDRCRRAKRSLTSLDDIPEPAAQTDFAPLDLDESKRQALLAEAHAMLYERAVPAIAQEAGGRFDRDGFGRAIGDMRELYHDRTTVEVLLAARDGGISTEGRNRLYQQHRRARTRLLEHLPGWLARQALTPLLETAVRSLAHAELAPRVDRGSRS